MADPVKLTAAQTSMDFGRRCKEAWDAMTDDEQIQFILDMPYRVILDLAAIAAHKETTNDPV